MGSPVASSRGGRQTEEGGARDRSGGRQGLLAKRSSGCTS